MTAPDGPVAFASVVKPHGVRGVVAVRVSPHHPGVLRPGLELMLRPAEGGGPDRTVTVRAVGGLDERALVAFDEVTDRTGAEGLRGAQLLASRDDLVPLEEDEFLFADLEGCRVFVDGREVGTVGRVRTLPTQEVLEVGDALVPFTKEAVPVVDVAARRIEVDPAFAVGLGPVDASGSEDGAGATS